MEELNQTVQLFTIQISNFDIIYGFFVKLYIMDRVKLGCNLRHASHAAR